jgi:hypothetical protein
MGAVRPYRYVFVFAALCLTLGVSRAGSFSFTGVFTQDDQHEIFTFTAPSASVLLRTYGYAGGTNALFAPISAGGFDPILSLFDSSGGLLPTSLLVAANDNGACGDVGNDPVTGNCFDSYLLLSTLAGSQYTLVLTQADNSANGPTYGDGFLRDGDPNFTAVFGCGGSMFCDQSPDQRNGGWAVDITGVDTAVDVSAVPEPASAFLLATSCAGLLLLRRRRNLGSRKSS